MYTYIKKAFLCLLTLSFAALSANTPPSIEKILQDAKNAESRSHQKVDVALKIKKKFDDISKYALKVDSGSKVTLLTIVELLCPHCHGFLSGIKNVNLQKEKINLWVISLPIFEGDQTREYGMLITQAYKVAPDKILEILQNYKFRDVDGFKRQLSEDYKVPLDEAVIKNLKSFDGHDALMKELEIPSVPMMFAVLNSAGENVIVPLPNYNAAEVVKVVHELEKLNDSQIKTIKDELKQ